MAQDRGQAWLLIIGVVGLLVLLFLGMWYLGRRIGSGRLLLTPPPTTSPTPTPEPARVLPPAPTQPPSPGNLPSTGPDPNAVAPPGYNY